MRLLRKFFPPDGPQYEMFNISMLYLVIVVCNYGLSMPDPSTRGALRWLLGETPLNVWSTMLVSSAVLAAVSSYRKDCMPVGLLVLGSVSALWSGALLTGWAFEWYSGTPDPRSFSEAVLFGAFTRWAIHLASQWTLIRRE